MATKYVIWDRSARAFVGGAQPLLFDQSADATAQATVKSAQSQRVDDSHRKPQPIYDVVSVTV